MGMFGKSDAQKRMGGYSKGVMPGDQERPSPVRVPGDRVGKAARGIFGGINRFASEVINPTTPLGQLGMYLGAASGSTLGEAALKSKYDRQDADQQELARTLKLRELYQPQYEKVGKDLVSIDPTTGEPTLVYQGEDEATAPAGVREWEYMQSLPEAQRAQFQQFRQPVPYGYTPQGIEAQAQIAGRTAAARAPYQGGSASAGLRVGQVVDGYTYTGGDPNDQSSWRR